MVAAALGLAACSSSSTTEGPEPAGATPSPIATMVCAPKAQNEIDGALGLTATVGGRSWVDHRYACRYAYQSGAMTLSVQELSSWTQTYAYFHRLGADLGVQRTLGNLGQGAFQTTDGSVVVRKDWKVLLVDVSALPPDFGVPPTSSGDVAVTVADLILGCWAGD